MSVLGRGFSQEGYQAQPFEVLQNAVEAIEYRTSLKSNSLQHTKAILLHDPISEDGPHSTDSASDAILISQQANQINCPLNSSY